VIVTVDVYSGVDLKQWFRTTDTQGNITKITASIKKTGTITSNVTVNIYEADENGSFSGDSSSLGSATISAGDITTSYGDRTATFSSAITVKPRKLYMIKLSTTAGDSSNKYYVEANEGLDSSSMVFSHVYGSSAYRHNYTTKITTYTTKQVNAYVGDNVYLSDTAGGISLNEGTYSYPIGRVLSSSEVMIGAIPRDTYLGGNKRYMLTTTESLPNGITYFALPRNCQKIIVQLAATTTDDAHTHQATLHRMGKTSGKISDFTGTYDVLQNSIAISGNTVYFTKSTGSANIVNFWYYT
jgi:hypothetical protein